MVKRLYAEDYALGYAMLALAIEVPTVTVSCTYGLGRHSVYVSEASTTKALYYFYLGIFPYYTGIAAARISIALLLLRLKQDSRIWNAVIWFVIVLQVVQGISSTVIQTLICAPTSALWDLYGDQEGVNCMDAANINIWGWISCASFIVTDIFLALLPLALIFPLRRSAAEKTLLALLMSVGLLASVASTIKAVYIGIYPYHPPDVLRNTLNLSLWAKIEELLVTIAASGPTLKVPIERLWRGLWRWVGRYTESARESKIARTKRKNIKNRNMGVELVVMGNEEPLPSLESAKVKACTDNIETEEELKPRWWFLPNRLVHTDLITTFDLNQKREKTRETTTVSSEERGMTSLGTDMTSLGTGVSSLGTSIGSQAGGIVMGDILVNR
jgi:hypothetical protein